MFSAWEHRLPLGAGGGDSVDPTAPEPSYCILLYLQLDRTLVRGQDLTRMSDQQSSSYLSWAPGLA